MSNIKILVVTHKPFKLLEGEYYVPIHAGRAIATERSKDGKINKSDYEWLLENTIGDDSGDNISDKNRYYSECSALYWAWKNYDKLGNPDYIGLMHYRRQFVFNEEYFENKPKDKWENALGFIREDFIDENYIKNIGLTDENIEKVCSEYDLVVSKDGNLDLIYNRNLREDYEKTIPGVKVKDFDLMVDIVKNKYTEYKEVVEQKINGYTKSLYQMFIMKKEFFFEYCEFLFGVLFEIEKTMNFDEYSMNGKRTLGYLAEDLLSIYVWKKESEGVNIKKLGATMVEYPYEDAEIKKILDKGCPSYLDYLKAKFKGKFLTGHKKQEQKEVYQGIRQQRKSYKKLKNLRGDLCQK